MSKSPFEFSRRPIGGAQAPPETVGNAGTEKGRKRFKPGPAAVTTYENRFTGECYLCGVKLDFESEEKRDSFILSRGKCRACLVGETGTASGETIAPEIETADEIHETAAEVVRPADVPIGLVGGVAKAIREMNAIIEPAEDDDEEAPLREVAAAEPEQAVIAKNAEPGLPPETPGEKPLPRYNKADLPKKPAKVKHEPQRVTPPSPRADDRILPSQPAAGTFEPPRKPGVEVGGEMGLPPAPPAGGFPKGYFEGRAPQRGSDVIKWVAEHLDEEGLRFNDCPSGAAWSMWQLYSQSPEMKSKFWQSVWPKVVPPASKENAGGESADQDGKVTLEFTRDMRRMAEAAYSKESEIVT